MESNTISSIDHVVLYCLLYGLQTAYMFKNKQLVAKPMTNTLTSDFVKSQVKNLLAAQRDWRQR